MKYTSKDYRPAVYEESDERLDDGSIWIAECQELGCRGQGSDPTEAIANAREMIDFYLAEYESRGESAPGPSHIEKSYSGKLVVRMSTRLHAQLAGEAEQYGISLNAHMVEILAGRHAAAQLQQQSAATFRRVSLAAKMMSSPFIVADRLPYHVQFIGGAYPDSGAADQAVVIEGARWRDAGGTATLKYALGVSNALRATPVWDFTDSMSNS